MHGDLALADEHARELDEMAERAGSINARLLGLVQRFVRLVSEGRADDLAGDFAEIVGSDSRTSRGRPPAHRRCSTPAGGGSPRRAPIWTGWWPG